MVISSLVYVLFFFFNDTATTEIYTLSLPTLFRSERCRRCPCCSCRSGGRRRRRNMVDRLNRGTGLAVAALAIAGLIMAADRKSTRLNSSHANISYAVFCLKKKQTSLHRADDDIRA